MRISVLLLLLWTLLSTTALAQTSRGTVSGTVTDPSGAVVANADITLTEQATNLTRTTVTNAAGLYRFDAVSLGLHNLEVKAQGFVPVTVTGVEVRANQISSQDFVLKVGATAEHIEVQAGAAAVALQVDDQLRGANIDAARISLLPVAGQNSLNLMLTVPGIAPTRTGNGGGVGSVDGSRARANKFMIDGADNNDISVAGQTITMTNNDAIQEVSIQTANYSAEFGRSGGAVVNQVTKSGSNTLHGTAAWVYLSQLFNGSTQAQRISYFGKLAKYQADPVNNAAPVLKPTWHENIPAFTAGGPVVIPHVYDGRNKTFWFVAGQWDHYTSAGSTYTFTVPTTAGISTLQGYSAKCPNVALYLQALGGMTANNQTGTLSLAVPSSVYTAGSTCNGDARTGVSIPYGTGTRQVPNSYKTYNVQFRVDHTISGRQNLMARVFESNETDQLYDAGISQAFDASATFQQWNASVAHNFSITNTLTNELRLNYTHPTYWWFANEAGLGGLPSFAFSTLSGFGTSANYPQGRIPNTYQLQDNMTKVVGHHQFRFGGEYFRQIARQMAPANLRGSVTYSNSGSGSTLVNGFANFMDDWSGWGTGRVARVYGSARYHPTYSAWSGFFQDNWKITQDLTLNLGLRYDYFGQAANIFTYPMVSFDPSGWSSAKIAPDKNNFGPTVGFAWNPKKGFLLGDGKGVIRGGFQIGYDTLFNNLLSNMATGTPNNPSNTPVNAPNAGRGLANSYSKLFPGMVNGGVATTSNGSSQFPSNWRSPYTERWSLGIQRELPQGMILDVSYVGSSSHKLNQQQELNPFGAPVQDPKTGVWTNGVRLSPTIGGRMVRANSANSNYEGLQTELKRRYTPTPIGSMLFTAAYTWSKSLSVIDDVFGTTAGSGVYMSANPLRAPYSGWRTSDYGPSDNDRRHLFVSSVVWDLPSPKMRFVNQILGGWSLTGVIPIRSGTPFTVWNGGDRDLDGTNNQDRPDIGNAKAAINTMAQPVAASVCSTGWQSVQRQCVNSTDVHWLYYPTGVNAPAVLGKTERRNSMISKGGFISADASIIKKFKFTERTALEYRAEIFNIANTMNYSITPINTTLSTIFNSYSATTGGPTTTFLDYSQSNAGNRTMRMQLKFIF